MLAKYFPKLQEPCICIHFPGVTYLLQSFCFFYFDFLKFYCNNLAPYEDLLCFIFSPRYIPVFCSIQDVQTYPYSTNFCFYCHFISYFFAKCITILGRCSVLIQVKSHHFLKDLVKSFLKFQFKY